jgi:hypothetical protein
MTLTYAQYKDYLIEWCKARGATFKYFFPLKGGWEAWVQADYAAFVLSKNSAYDILREVAIYKNNYQRVDWLFNNNDVVAQKIAVEIKCQSFENHDSFIAGVGADIDKLAQDNLKLSFQTCQTGVMGIYFEEKARTWMLANEFTELFNNGEVGCAIRKLF